MSISYLNAERYADPTAYQALTNIERAEKRQFRPLVYVCSPYSGDVEANTEAARRYCRFAVDKGYIPVAPHLLYPRAYQTSRSRGRRLRRGFRDCTEYIRIHKPHSYGRGSREVEHLSHA